MGNATDISLARRVQLAVGAYVRHQYTDYDAMLKERVSWAEARRLAEPASYAKLLEWRDETNNPELEEIFREIIVIDDEEGDDEDDDPDESDSFDSRSGDNSREPSFEIISSQARGRELQPDLAAGSRSHANGYHSRAPVSSGAYPSFSVAPPNPNSSSATLAQPRHSRVYSAAPLQRFRQYVSHMYILWRITHHSQAPNYQNERWEIVRGKLIIRPRNCLEQFSISPLANF